MLKIMAVKAGAGQESEKQHQRAIEGKVYDLKEENISKECICFTIYEVVCCLESECCFYVPVLPVNGSEVNFGTRRLPGKMCHWTECPIWKSGKRRDKERPTG